MALVAWVSKEAVSGEVTYQPHRVSTILEDQLMLKHRSWSDYLVISMSKAGMSAV